MPWAYWTFSTGAFPPLVSTQEEVESLKHDLELLGIPHDEEGLLLE